MSPGIIVWNGKKVTVAWWDGEEWQKAIDVEGCVNHYLDPAPTHWMPFPSPPTK